MDIDRAYSLLSDSQRSLVDSVRSGMSALYNDDFYDRSTHNAFNQLIISVVEGNVK